MGKRAYISDGVEWIPLVSSIPNLDAYATTEYVDENLDNIDALPSQSTNDGKFLTTDGSIASWADVDLSPYLTQSSASTQYEKLIPYAASAPPGVITGDMWIDSSGTAPLLKMYSGSGWTQLGSSDDVFMRLNLKTIDSDYTIPLGYNGVTAGPITIANGVVVTIPDGSSWSVV